MEMKLFFPMLTFPPIRWDRSADGLLVSDLLQAIIPLFELDSYAPPLVMMAAVEGDTLDPEVERRYRNALSL